MRIRRRATKTSGSPKRRKVTSAVAVGSSIAVASFVFFFQTPETYRAEDFPCSKLFEGPCRPQASAERANDASTRVSRFAAGVVLSQLANARVGEWRGEQGATEGLSAAASRTTTEEITVDSRRGPEWKEIHERALRDLRLNGSDGFRPLRYVALDGETLHAGEIRSSGLTATIRLCSPERSAQILADVLQRLDRLRQGRGTLAQARTSFLDALYGFLVAVPYVRGNEEIARELFAAVHRGIFGARLPPLPDSLEMLALTATSPEEFRSEVARALRWRFRDPL